MALCKEMLDNIVTEEDEVITDTEEELPSSKRQKIAKKDEELLQYLKQHGLTNTEAISNLIQGKLHFEYINNNLGQSQHAHLNKTPTDDEQLGTSSCSPHGTIFYFFLFTIQIQFLLPIKSNKKVLLELLLIILILQPLKQRKLLCQVGI